MAENKLQPLDVPVEEVLAALPDRKRHDAETLIDLMAEVSGEPVEVWTHGIIGFGRFRYRYASGHGGVTGKIGFAPRKANLVVYFNDGLEGRDEQLARLGKHRAGKGCLYITKLADVDLDVLREMVAESWAEVHDIDEYIR